MKYFVTGGSGFIGSNLVDRLLDMDNDVVAYDNFSTGFQEFLVEAKNNPKFSLVSGDLLEKERIVHAMKDCDFVFHLAANADVRFGIEHPSKDLNNNTIGRYLLPRFYQNNISFL